MKVTVTLTQQEITHAIMAYVVARNLGMVIKTVELENDKGIPISNIQAQVTCEEQPPPPDAWGR